MSALDIRVDVEITVYPGTAPYDGRLEHILTWLRHIARNRKGIDLRCRIHDGSRADLPISTIQDVMDELRVSSPDSAVDTEADDE